MKKLLSTFTLLLVCVFAQAFDESKYYVINRNGISSAYMYANGNNIMASSLDKTNGSFIWQLIPTGTTNGYYLKNVGSGMYAQTCNIALSSLVELGANPVEYIVSTGAGSTTYFMASNDQGAINYNEDATLGLNFGASGVCAFYIKTGRGNSYWTITETNYSPTPPEPSEGEDEDVQPNVHAYRIPCGTFRPDTKLTQIDITGEGVWHELHYAPLTNNKFMIQTGAHASLMRGGKVKITAQLKGAEVAGLVVAVCADFNGDGRFEQIVKPTVAGTIEAELTVPAESEAFTGRIRIRVDQGGNYSANGDIAGVIYDIPIQIVNAQAQRLIEVVPNSKGRGLVSIIGSDAHSTMKNLGDVVTVKAQAAEGWVFKGWLLGNDIVSTNEQYSFQVTAAVHLIAIFGKYIEPEKPIVYAEPADGLRFRLRNKERDTYYMVEDASNHLVIAEDRYAEGGTFTLEKADASSYYIKTASGRYVYQAGSGSQANKTTSATKVKYTITASGEHLYNFGATGSTDANRFLHAAADHLNICGWTQNVERSQWYMQKDDTTVGIVSIQDERLAAKGKDSKFIENNQLIIRKGGKKFNARGQRIK